MFISPELVGQVCLNWILMAYSLIFSLSNEGLQSEVLAPEIVLNPLIWPELINEA